ncbi:MAG: undecaprenyl-diphosphatase UppP [Clostridia bacterium]|nr:MAG: undecaprenyl-diphosphatase UppP [Clostridia bacterium]
MTTFHAFILGLIQGLTEFLPVSSSGHLVLLPWWLGWDVPGLAFDALLHWGTLLAVVIYFWRDWWEMWMALVRKAQGHPVPGKDHLLLAIIIGTIPAALLGFLFQDFFENLFGQPAAVAIFLIITGFLLILAEHWTKTHQQGRPMEKLSYWDALLVGIGQALAIAPGISRSGSTIAAGLLRRLDRPTAARFSFLMGTPIIFGAGLLKLKDLIEMGINGTGLTPLVVGFLTAFVSGILAIGYLLRYLKNHTLTIFAYYVWAVALLSLARYFLM